MPEFAFLNLHHYLSQLCLGLSSVAVLTFASVAYRHFAEASTLFFTDKEIHR